MSLIAELKRRNVIRIAVLYLVAGWVILQVGDIVFPALGVPDWSIGLVLGLLMLGFPIALIFSWVYELTPEGIKRETDIDRTASITGATGQKVNVLIVALLVLAIGVVVADRLIPEGAAPAATATTSGQDAPQERAPDADAAAEAAAPVSTDPSAVAADMFMNTAPEKSVAVLPFVNMSGDPENEFFSDGLSEELLNVLAGNPDLFVAARTSSFHFKGHTGDIADIARRLRVRNVLEGSVRRSGQRVRITAQLIDASNGYHLWSNTYDRTLEDVFAVQDEISRQVAESLKVALLDEDSAEPDQPTENIDAYLAFLQGQQYLADGGVGGFERAVDSFTRATELDPEFAEAHAGLAIAWGSLLNWGNTGWQEGGPPLRAAADRALELDDGLALAWVADGLARAYSAKSRRDDPQALRSMERAAEIAPEDVTVSYWYAVALRWNGRSAESITPLQRALARDPFSSQLNAQLARAQTAVGNLDAARESYRRVTELTPQNPSGPDGMAVVERARGRYDQAVVWQYRTLQADPADTFSAAMLAADYLNLDDLDRARRWQGVAEQMDPDAPMTRMARALVALYSGDRAGAEAEARRYFEDDLGGETGPAEIWMSQIRARQMLAAGEAAEAAAFLLDGLSADDRIDTTTGQSEFFRYLRALPAVEAYDPVAARRMSQSMLRLAGREDARLEPGTLLIARCALTAFGGDASRTIPLCREQLQKTVDIGPIYWQFSDLYAPVRDDPAWQAFVAEILAARAEQLDRLRDSGDEPPAARILPATEQT